MRIRRAAPTAQEKTAYGIPTYTPQGNLVHFAAFTAHIGLYPGPAAVAAFSRELDAFRTTKGAIQFPHDARLPLELIAKIVKSCVAARRQALARVRAKPPR
jgi:uncharacterized protein YdhG (YjbR/CyaY superfamily)